MNVKLGMKAALVVAGVLSASAGTVLGTSSQALWNGGSYATQTWNVATDAPATGGTPPFFQPEGMTFFGGNLYVVGDSEETNPALVRYTPGAGGNLSAGTGLPMSAQGAVWGPEGVTVNPSGRGYGAFTGSVPTLVSVESRNRPISNFRNFVGAVELGNGSPAPVTNIHQPVTTFAPDDIAYVPSLDQFVVINDPARLDFYTHDATTLTSTGNSILTQSLSYGDAKGVTLISEAFAELITGLDLSGETLMVAHESNDLTLWTLAGTRIGDALRLTSLIRAPQAIGLSQAESLAVDELNGLIYIGDESGLAITVLQVPEPTTLAMLALVAVAGLRRR